VAYSIIKNHGGFIDVSSKKGEGTAFNIYLPASEKPPVKKKGKEALDIYKRSMDKIHLIVLDMIMPEMGGEETYNRLKKINPDVKVLLSSGYSLEGRATEILEQGCNGFIQKPFNIESLSNKIREILDKKQMGFSP